MSEITTITAAVLDLIPTLEWECVYNNFIYGDPDGHAAFRATVDDHLGYQILELSGGLLSDVLRSQLKLGNTYFYEGVKTWINIDHISIVGSWEVDILPGGKS